MTAQPKQPGANFGRLPVRLAFGLFLAIALDTALQTIWKRAALALPDNALSDPLAAALSVLHQPMFMLVGLLIAFQMINWLKVLDDADVSFALPITALSYVSVAALSAIGEAMPQIAKGHRAFMLVWKDMPEALEADMAQAASLTGFFSTPSYPGAEARFPTGRKADFLSAMKSSHRQQLKRKLRRSAEAADLSVEVVQAPGQELLDEIFALFMQTYEKALTRFERLDMRFFARVALEPRAHFLLLRDRANGRLAAFMLLFDLGDTVINKFIGIDYARPKDEMLYFRLTDAAIDWAIAKGATRLQSGQTGYRVKIELGHALTPLTNFGRHRIRPIHAIYALVARTISWKTLDTDLAHHLQSHPENPMAESGKWG